MYNTDHKQEMVKIRLEQERQEPPNLDEEIKTLVRLGLTFCQARTFIALSNIGEATIEEIARASHIARPNIYQTIATLQEMGMIEKIITRPTKFKAIPMKKAVDILLQNKTDELKNIKQKAKKLAETFYERKELIAPLDEKQNFVLLPIKGDMRHRLYKAFRRVKSNIVMINSTQMFERWDAIDFQMLERASRRNVKIRLLTREQSDEIKLLKVFEKRKLPLEIKLAPEIVPIRVILFDGTELFYAISYENYPHSTPHLWTNNACLIALVEDYFEKTWQNSKQCLKNLASN